MSRECLCAADEGGGDVSVTLVDVCTNLGSFSREWCVDGKRNGGIGVYEGWISGGDAKEGILRREGVLGEREGGRNGGKDGG